MNRSTPMLWAGLVALGVSIALLGFGLVAGSGR